MDINYIPVVVSAKYIKDYKIKVTFDNGIQKVVDCQKWLDGRIFEPLKEKKEFKKFFVDG